MSDENVLNPYELDGTPSPRSLPKTGGEGKGEGDALRENDLLKLLIGIVLVLLVSVNPAFGKSYLLYLEAQGVGWGL